MLVVGVEARITGFDWAGPRSVAMVSFRAELYVFDYFPLNLYSI